MWSFPACWKSGTQCAHSDAVRWKKYFSAYKRARPWRVRCRRPQSLLQKSACTFLTKSKTRSQNCERVFEERAKIRREKIGKWSHNRVNYLTNNCDYFITQLFVFVKRKFLFFLIFSRFYKRSGWCGCALCRLHTLIQAAHANQKYRTSMAAVQKPTKSAHRAAGMAQRLLQMPHAPRYTART